MNEAFEKIIERIDKEIPVYTGKAKQIVQEVAEEYKGGWISCSGCKECHHKECEHYGEV